MLQQNSLQQSIWEIKNTWDTAHPDNVEIFSNSSNLLELVEQFGSIFCSGPFYYYVFNFTKKIAEVVSPNFSKIIGIPSSKLNVSTFLEVMHPDDRSHFIQCEKVAGQFLHEYINSPEILRYKVNYFFRLKKANGDYGIFQHQALALGLDKNLIVKTALSIDTEVSHIFSFSPKSISFMDIKGLNSFMKVDPYNYNFSQIDNQTQLLSIREKNIIELFSQGFGNEEIGAKLYISPHTVRTHRNNIRNKMGAKNTTQAVAIALREGFI